MSDTAQLIKLRQELERRFSEDELRTLCQDLGVEYDDLPVQGRASKARELVAHMDRRGQLDELERKLTAYKPPIIPPPRRGPWLLIGIVILAVIGVAIWQWSLAERRAISAEQTRSAEQAQIAAAQAAQARAAQTAAAQAALAAKLTPAPTPRGMTGNDMYVRGVLGSDSSCWKYSNKTSGDASPCSVDIKEIQKYWSPRLLTCEGSPFNPPTKIVWDPVLTTVTGDLAPGRTVDVFGRCLVDLTGNYIYLKDAKYFIRVVGQ